MAHAKDGSNTRKVKNVVNKRLILLTLHHYAKKYSFFIGQPISAKIQRGDPNPVIVIINCPTLCI